MIVTILVSSPFTDSTPANSAPKSYTEPGVRPSQAMQPGSTAMKPDQNRPKRYSSQRQRTAPESPYPEVASPETSLPTNIPQGAPPRMSQQGAGVRMPGPRGMAPQPQGVQATQPRQARPPTSGSSPNAKAPPFYPRGEGYNRFTSLSLKIDEIYMLFIGLDGKRMPF